MIPTETQRAVRELGWSLVSARGVALPARMRSGWLEYQIEDVADRVGRKCPDHSICLSSSTSDTLSRHLAGDHVDDCARLDATVTLVHETLHLCSATSPSVDVLSGVSTYKYADELTVELAATRIVADALGVEPHSCPIAYRDLIDPLAEQVAIACDCTVTEAVDRLASAALSVLRTRPVSADLDRLGDLIDAAVG